MFFLPARQSEKMFADARKYSYGQIEQQDENLRHRYICFGHVPVAVRQGQRRDAVATGEE
jgi:hypothetical protein